MFFLLLCGIVQHTSCHTTQQQEQHPLPLLPQGVPTNELHASGYISIGCEPCTRAVLPNQHEREGRWWWEDATAKECGLHSGNVVQGAVDQAAEEVGDGWRGGGDDAWWCAKWVYLHVYCIMFYVCVLLCLVCLVATFEWCLVSTPKSTSTIFKSTQRVPITTSPHHYSLIITPPHQYSIIITPPSHHPHQGQKDLWEGSTAVKTFNKEQLAAVKSGPRDQATLVALYAPWCQYCKALEPSYEALAEEMAGSGVTVAKFQADVERYGDWVVGDCKDLLQNKGLLC